MSGISKVFFNKASNLFKWNEEEGKLDPNEPYKIETEGSNLRKVMIQRGVDATTIVSNDVLEMLDVLGIEAARNSLFNELRDVLSFDGSYVNYRHMAILVDTMTFSGTILPVNRNGVNKSSAGALLRASFERTVDVLLDSATFAERNDVNGVTENILLGQMSHAGTGTVEVMLDKDALLKIEDRTKGTLRGMAPGMVENGAMRQMVTSPGIMSPFGDMMSPSPFSSEGTMSPFDQGDLVWSPSGFSPPSGGSSPLARGGSSSPLMNYGSSSPLSQPRGEGAFKGSVSSPYISSPQYNVVSSPVFSPNSSPQYQSQTSPNFNPGVSSPMYGSVTSPQYNALSSPMYSPSSPQYDGPVSSPMYSPSSPQYDGPVSSPMYSPSSPTYMPSGNQAGFSPTSPSYSPVDEHGDMNQLSPTSPSFSPTSPSFSPTSPSFSPTSPAMDEDD